MKKALLGYFLLMIVYGVKGQEFGGNPPSIRWKQINTDTIRIIFPAGMDSIAQRISSVVHYMAKNNALPLGNSLRKVNLVLQTQTTVSNAYVGLAPFRSEFYLTPLMNNFELGSVNWEDGLAVHEYRHVQQFNNFRNGITAIAYYLFGEEGWLVMSNAAIPDWFFEGDAVFNETILTEQGRGRIPFFLNQYKSLWLEKKDYSWMKLRNGSLKDYVPNHYPLGYLMVNYGREKYGADFWAKVTKDASAFKGLFYPFQKAVKKYSGVRYTKFRNDAFDYYQSLATNEGGKDPKHPFMDTARARAVSDSLVEIASAANNLTVNGRKEEMIKDLTIATKNYVTNYYYPYQSGDSLIYLKTSFRHRPTFSISHSGRKKDIREKDISLDERFSYRNGKIVYAAYETDPRWGWKDYSVIRILDVRTHKQRTLKHKTKYFTPDISPGGTRIATVEVFPGKNSLLVLDAEDGKIIQDFHSVEINLFTDPKFIDDSLLVIAVRLNDGKMALARADIASGAIERLTVPSYAIIGNPYVENGVVYFTGSFTGNDEIYAMRLSGKGVYRLTKTDLGNYFVNAQNNNLVWSRFTSDGFQLKEMNAGPGIWEEVPEAQMTNSVLPFPVALSDTQHDILVKDVAARTFNISRYNQAGHLFYFHSWRPYAEDPDYTYSIYSDNILNTFSTEFFYHYNRDDKTHGVGANLVYGGLYPFISGGVEYTFSRPITINNIPTRLDELELRIGLSLPLSFTRGLSYKFLNLGTNYYIDHLSFKTGKVNFTYLHHFISWSQQVERAVQHIYPRWGYSLSLNHRYGVTEYEGYQSIANASIYLPGIHTTHNLVLSGSIQQRDTTNILFSNHFTGSRGYNEYHLSRMWRGSANYHFPFFYPDWGFANLLYFQRIRGNGFFDFTRVYSTDKTISRDLRSVGGEIYFDTRWWNAYSLTFGFRVSHLLDNDLVGRTAGSNKFEFLVPIVIPK